MTERQLMKKIEVARKTGHATFEDGCEIRTSEKRYGIEFSLYDAYGNCIRSSWDPKDFLFVL